MREQYDVNGHLYERGDDGKFHLVQEASPSSLAAPASPIIVKRAPPKKPEFVPGATGYVVADDGSAKPLPGLPSQKTTYHVLTAEEKTQRGLPVSGTYQIDSDGKVSDIATPKAGEKADPRIAQMMTALNQDATFRAIQRAQGDIKAGHGAGWWSYLSGIPNTNAQLVRSDLGTINAQNMLGKLGELKAQSATGASGMGALSDTEGRILRDSIANIDQSLPPERLLENLRFIENHYRRAAAISHGLDPDKVGPGETADKTAQTVTNPTGSQIGLTRNKTQSVVDPTMQAVARKVGSMIASRAPDQEILDHIRSAGVDPASTSIGDVLKYRNTPQFEAWQRKNPGVAYPIDRSFYTKEVPLGTVSSLMNTDAGRTAGAFEIGAGQAVTGNRLSSIAGALGGNKERVKDVEELARTEHPYAALAGDVAGQAAFEGLGKIAPTTRALMASKWGKRGADAVYGAYAGSGDDGGQGGLGGAVEGAVTNTLGGMGGRVTQRGVGNVLTGARDEGLRYLNERGIPLTLGQMARSGDGVGGKIVAGIEDRLAGYPVVGDFIKSARKRGIQGMDVAAFNEGMAPIGGDIAKRTGAPAVDRIQDLTSQAYSNALDGVNVPHDQQFISDYMAAKTVASKIPVHGPQIVHTLEAKVEPYLANGNLSGGDLQASLQRLRSEAAAYHGLPGGTDAADALGGVENAMTGLVGRQAPDVMPALNNANAAYRNQQILQNAVNSSTSGQDQLFTGAQLRRASINNTKNFGGANAAASTDRPFYDLSTHADNILPSSVPDSGSAGRWVLPAAVMGIGGGGGAAAGGQNNRSGGAELGAGLGAAMMLPYTKGGQKALQALVMGERMKRIVQAGQLLKDYTGPGSSIGSAAARDYYLYPDALPEGQR